MTDVDFIWEDDWSVSDHQREYDCYDDGGPDTCESCVMFVNGELVNSLHCIDDATDEYRRTIERELLDEYLADMAQRWATVDRWLTLAP